MHKPTLIVSHLSSLLASSFPGEQIFRRHSNSFPSNMFSSSFYGEYAYQGTKTLQSVLNSTVKTGICSIIPTFCPVEAVEGIFMIAPDSQTKLYVLWTQNRDLPCKPRSKTRKVCLGPFSSQVNYSDFCSVYATCFYWPWTLCVLPETFCFTFSSLPLQNTVSIHEPHFLFLTHFSASLPPPNAAVPVGRPTLVFRSPAWGSFCMGKTQLYTAPCKPHATLFSLGLFGGKLGLWGLVFCGCLVGFSFSAFYFLPMTRRRENCEKQAKEEELVPKLCLLRSLIYRLFLQGSVLTAAETTHISVDSTCFQKERLKGGHLAPQDLACLLNACFMVCGLKRRKWVPSRRSTFGWQPARTAEVLPPPSLVLPHLPGKQFTFSLKEREEREN